ncbi:MAG: TIGR01458 family HAD-type hydrolase [Planctomycetes bacterium]|nr:TIGR01458 family HAD-type hydrolase [Planctomycetota bacterium]
MVTRLRDVRAFAFDLDGTLYDGGVAIDGAVAAVTAVRAAGAAVRFVTNTTSRSRRRVVERLAALGFAAAEHEVLTPLVAAGTFLRERGATARLLVADAAREDFGGVADAERPDFVVFGDVGFRAAGESLQQAFDLLMGGAELIALGRTRYWQHAGRLLLDVGAWTAALEYATGRAARVFGKPAPEFFRALVEGLALPAGQVALVGDDLVTDVRAAQAAGLVGVLVRTGKFRPADLASAGPAPDVVIDSVAALAGRA